jgi:uncharacterized membrane protein YbhN (UPF0104 family)
MGLKRQVLLHVLKYGLGLGLLAYVIYCNWAAAPASNGPGLGEALARPVQLGALTLATLFCLLSVPVTFVRWHVLVRAQSLPFTVSEAFRLGTIGFFFGTFLPGAIGGDVVKAAVIARQQTRRAVAVATVIMDRFMALWGLVWLAALLGGAFWAFGDPTICSDRRLQGIILAAAAMVGATLSGWFLLGLLPAERAERLSQRLARLPAVGRTAAELWSALRMYRLQTRKVGLALLLSLMSHGLYIVSFWFAAQVFWRPAEHAAIPSLAEHLLLVPIGMVIQTVFPAPGGVGGSEFGFGKLYALAGSLEAGGVLACLALRAICWGLGLTGYLACLLLGPGWRISTERILERTVPEVS